MALTADQQQAATVAGAFTLGLIAAYLLHDQIDAFVGKVKSKFKSA
jgi:hypothetical protein